MRIDEFNRAAGIHRKRSLAACFGPLSATFAGMVAFIPFRDGYAAFLSARYDAETAEMLLVVPMIVLAVLCFGSMIPLSRWVDRTFGIRCPHCGGALEAKPAIVIASRNCPHCGRRVIED